MFEKPLCPPILGKTTRLGNRLSSVRKGVFFELLFKSLKPLFSVVVATTLPNRENKT
jgi:hypothetical protein